MKKRIISAILGTLFTTSVLAETSEYYAGGSILSAETDLAGESEYNSGYEIHLGYKINSSFSVEASYLDLGGYDLTKSNVKYSIDTDAISLSALYTYPIGSFNLIGRLGYLSQSSNVSVAPAMDNFSDESGGGVLFGAGLSYKFNKTIEVKTEFNVSSNTNYGLVGFNVYF
jgi:hypothetical protein